MSEQQKPSDPDTSTETEAIAAWLRGRLPADWFTERPEVSVDRDEILVVGRLAVPDLPEGGDDEETEAAAAESAYGRVQRFREDTRERRMRIAREARHRFGRKVAWGARCGPVDEVWTQLAVPVMTRLRQPERQVLDTLVESGVARSRADALAWCVRLVGEHTEDWLASLREAMTEVQRLRQQGPAA